MCMACWRAMQISQIFHDHLALALIASTWNWARKKQSVQCGQEGTTHPVQRQNRERRLKACISLRRTGPKSNRWTPPQDLVADKIPKRVNLINKLAGSSWGANFTTLHTSVPALVYAAVIYAVPVWFHSHHTSAVDTVLNDALRAISGCMALLPQSCFQLLETSPPPPPSIRRDQLVLKLAEKSNDPNCLVPRIACYPSIAYRSVALCCSGQRTRH